MSNPTRRQAALATLAATTVTMAQQEPTSPVRKVRIAFLGIRHSHGEGKLEVVR